MYSVGADYYDEPSEGDEAGNPNINRSDWTKNFIQTKLVSFS